MQPKRKLTKLLPYFFLLGIWLLLGCGSYSTRATSPSAPLSDAAILATADVIRARETSTSMPSANSTATPVTVKKSIRERIGITSTTAKERVEIYRTHLQWYMSLLLQNVEEIESHKNNAPDAFNAGLSIVRYYRGAVEIELPAKADFESSDNKFGSDYDPAKMQTSLIVDLASCENLGELAFNAESVSLDSLLSANAECKAVLIELKEQMPSLFDCPRELGLCAPLSDTAILATEEAAAWDTDDAIYAMEAAEWATRDAEFIASNGTIELWPWATEYAEYYTLFNPKLEEEGLLGKETPSPPEGCPGGCIAYPSWCEPPIKGNVSFKDGERIYHMLDDEFYDETKINPDYDERYFCTPEEAEAAGFRRAYN